MKRVLKYVFFTGRLNEMLFYMALQDAYDLETGFTLVRDQLLTKKERLTKAKSLPDSYFKIVDINRNKTHFFYGGIRLADHDAFTKTDKKGVKVRQRVRGVKDYVKK